MSIAPKIGRLVTLLNRKTSDDVISWVAIDPPDHLVEGNSDIIPLYFETEYKGKSIGIFERRYRFYTDEYEYHYETELALAVLDDLRRVIWISENTRIAALHDLFSKVREKVSGIDDLLDNLLDEEQEN